MKLSDYRGEEAIDLLADLLDPVSVILTDTEFRDAVGKKKTNLQIVQLLLKRHKKEVLLMMALIDQEDPETYKPSIFGLPLKLMEILNMPEMSLLFMSQGQTTESGPSGSAMESIEEAED